MITNHQCHRRTDDMRSQDRTLVHCAVKNNDWLINYAKNSAKTDVLKVLSKESAAVKDDGRLRAAAGAWAWHRRWLDIGVVGAQQLMVAGQRLRQTRRRQPWCIMITAWDVVRVVVRSLVRLGFTMMIVMMMMILVTHLRTDKAARYHVWYVAFITRTPIHARRTGLLTAHSSCWNLSKTGFRFSSFSAFD